MKPSVELVKSWGDDLEVYQAAFVNPEKQPAPEDMVSLIEKMAEEKHDSPFMHGGASMILELPLILWCQLDRSRIGFGLNQYSRRYRTATPEITMPRWRKKGETREGASDGETVEDPDLDYYFKKSVEECVSTYEFALLRGVAPEQARFILPQGLMTRVYWSGSLLAWARMCNLRLARDTQLETQQYARKISDIMAKEFPVSWAALVPASQDEPGRQAEIDLTIV